MANETNEAPPKKRGKGLIILMLLGLLALGAGASAPWLIGGHHHDWFSRKKVETTPHKQVALPFDNVVVNLGDDRVNRYLRVKLMVAVDEPDSHEVTELLAKRKPFLKSWLIGHLHDQSFNDVSRKVNVNRLRREIRDQFNQMLYPNGEEKIAEILFDEFQVQ